MPGPRNPYDDSMLDGPDGAQIPREPVPAGDYAKGEEAKADLSGGGFYGGMVPTGEGEGNAEIPSAQMLPRPVIMWGVVGATVATLKDVFTAGRHLIDIDEVKITPAFPMGEQATPNIQVGVTNFTVEHYGIHPLHIHQPEHKLYPGEDATEEERKGGTVSVALKSSGEIQLDIYARNPQQAMILQDYITQVYLLGVLYSDAFYFQGADRDYVAITYQPGKIRWATITDKNNESNENESFYSATATFAFIAEHKTSYRVGRLEEVTLEGEATQIPLEATVQLRRSRTKRT